MKVKKTNKFEELVEIESEEGFIYEQPDARAVFAGDLGARVFCELRGVLLHRLDIENVRHRNQEFNNYGGNNFWPAPEGGMFGFNYKADQWYVQAAVNNEPFVMVSKNDTHATASKEAVLENRKGSRLEVVMQRIFAVGELPEMISDLKPAAYFCYTIDDSITVNNSVTVDEALLACWSLEQFYSSDSTVSFAKVNKPQAAINFDFYDHPGERIIYGDNGFSYKTDSKKRGQIGIKTRAGAEFIGFCDFEKKLLCVREIVDQSDGLYFNIADNDQEHGPFSAADNYSIFNGDKELGFFEIETIGCAEVQSQYLKGSRLKSKTSFAVFDNDEPLKQFTRWLK